MSKKKTWIVIKRTSRTTNSIFDEAKDLTVGQVIRKNEEVEAGVLPEDSILDKYIKQHREEIEADKFETRQFKKKKNWLLLKT